MSKVTHVFFAGITISAACAKDTNRYAINGVSVLAAADGKSGMFEVTDGKMGAIKPIQDLSVEPGAPRNVIAPAKLFGKIKKGDNGMAMLNGEWRRGNNIFQPEEGVFPPLDAVIPEGVANDTTAGAIQWIGIDANLLADLAKALGGDSDNGGKVFVGIRSPTKPILVTDAGQSGVGILMPVGLSDSKKDHKTAALEIAARYDSLAAQYRELAKGRKEVVAEPAATEPAAAEPAPTATGEIFPVVPASETPAPATAATV